MYAEDLAIGIRYEYSDEYVDAWERAYLDGRESYDDFIAIGQCVMTLVGLTFNFGVVIVMGPSGKNEEIHVDNLKLLQASNHVEG